MLDLLDLIFGFVDMVIHWRFIVTFGASIALAWAASLYLPEGPEQWLVMGPLILAGFVAGCWWQLRHDDSK